jgi:hypothetical protein
MTLKAYSQVCNIDPTNTTASVQPDGSIASCPVTPSWVLNDQIQNFDITQGVGFWTVGFTSVMFFYLIAKGVGTVLRLAKYG